MLSHRLRFSYCTPWVRTQITWKQMWSIGHWVIAFLPLLWHICASQLQMKTLSQCYLDDFRRRSSVIPPVLLDVIPALYSQIDNNAVVANANSCLEQYIAFRFIVNFKQHGWFFCKREIFTLNPKWRNLKIFIRQHTVQISSLHQSYEYRWKRYFLDLMENVSTQKYCVWTSSYHF